MDATMVLRFAIVMFIEQLSYRMLYERVADSIILRDFCGIPFGLLPSFSTLQVTVQVPFHEYISAMKGLSLTPSFTARHFSRV